MGGDERDYDVPDPVDPQIIYGTGLGGRVSKWDARTGQVQNIAPWPVSSYGKRPTPFKYHYLWVTPLATSRTGPPTLYLGAQVLFASTDRGEHWNVISPDLTGKTPARPALRRRRGHRRRQALRLRRHLVDRALAAPRRGDLGRLRRRPRPRHPRRRQELEGRHPAGRGRLGQDLLDRRLAAGGRRRLRHRRRPAPGRLPAARVQDPRRRGDLDRHLRRPAARPLRRRGPRRYRTPGSAFRRQRHVPSSSPSTTARSWRPLQQNLPTAWVRDLLVHGTT